LAALNNNHEPESAEAALQIYAQLMLPERNLDPTIQRLNPFIYHPTFENTLEKAIKEKTISSDSISVMGSDEVVTTPNLKQKPKIAEEKDMLAQVVGIIIGSPEFQRR